MSALDGIDHLILCHGCSDREGYPVYRHKTFFRVGRRNCAVCEVAEEFEKAARLRTSHVLWKPDHGPRPLVTDYEKEGIAGPEPSIMDEVEERNRRMN